MSKNYNDSSVSQPPVISPPRPHQQLRRSITEQSPPFRHHFRPHHYLPRKDREREDRHPVPSLLPMRASLDLSRPEPPTLSPIPDISPKLSSNGDSAAIANPQHRPKPTQDVWEQKQKTKAVVAGLRSSIDDLDTFSKSTVARLDESYSSIRQRIRSLQDTILAIKELAGASQELNQNFKTESQTLLGEVESQLSPYEQTDDQKKRIQDLQTRIHSGRDKVQALSKRVDVVRDRIESWERADKEWQERTRRRLRLLWIITLVVALAVASLALWVQYLAPLEADFSHISRPVSGNRDMRPSFQELVGNKSKNAAVMAEIREELSRKRGHDSDTVEVEALRLFDEL